MFSAFTRGMALLPLGGALVLSGCSSGNSDLQARYDALAAQNQQLAAQNQQLAAQNQQLMARTQSLTTDVGRLSNAIRYTINSDLLFKSGSWEMTAAGQETIAKFASQLAPGQRRNLVVNGYTDDQPVGRGLQQAGVTSNEVLSQKRAEAVMQYLISQGVKPDMVSARGWGAQQPIASNSTPEGRAQNRRVEITTE